MPYIKKTAGKKAPAKRKLAEVFALGEVLTDTSRKEWKLGVPIGQGGFGRLYLADVNSSKSVGSDAPYVVKVEPSQNGPLFTELKFYMRAAKPDEIQKWTKSHKLKYLGVPRYWGSGLHEKSGNSYRFMIMDRFGRDLQKVYEENAKRFAHKTVLQLGLRILDILEYIHEHEYVHGDIKASNLLQSYKNPNQVYLVDYGLAYRYCPEGVHKAYKEDPKRCHDGTIEYTSIDAHKGVATLTDFFSSMYIYLAPSRRGDLEILGYCMVHWLSGHLPWEDNLKDPNFVRDSKIRCRDNISELMEKCFPGKNKPDEIRKYMEKVKQLSYEEKPVYPHFREILLQGLKSIGQKDDGVLDFGLSENGDVQTNPVQKMAAEGQSDIMASDMEARMKQRCIIEFLHAEKIAPIDIHRRLLNVYGDQTVDVSTVRRWVVRFSSGDNDLKDKPRSGRPCTAVTPRNEERLNQLIQSNLGITTRELCTELNIGFNALETMKKRKAAAAANESSEAEMEDAGSPEKKKPASSKAVATRTRKVTSPKTKKSAATRKRVQK
ncbi:serine/threonine-protein kinase VRK1 isoform X1 [Gallus gallus]|nr:serine/threonine-protein kinase VRK1 isoform X1 [Gallus gallus]XP_040556986.2 serine/threonine-protein kinase VRK1 isoform X1 [Gallus gallus]XP_040556988.1 serine/threonine-protein kinase VRK1 isoform X1 [Gallus gallus]XP_046774605.1 serine/threonine-protein kinase VRK1 isoform X1 [Gallus gallus]XP_046774609.1 serine/threonine-protein kinase VRK1 isoform X1 [Gallus gallus]XP_046774612.1 serine/threonine-protein kinase VRK1 isoform X1 [Gallus gallus]XP_046774613.1 serine/threonine-protein k